MRHYETLLLFSPELGAEERKALQDKFVSIIEGQNGQMIEVDDWGMRELAYAVNKVNRGVYVRLEYNAPTDTVAELERNLRITDGLFKFISVQLGDEPKTAEDKVEA